MSDKKPFYPARYTSELSLGNRVGRMVWSIVRAFLFRASPRLAFGWRRMLLRIFGAKIASDVRVYPCAFVYAPWNLEMRRGSVLGDGVYCYNVDKVIFEEESNVTHFAFLCTAQHDVDCPRRTLVTAPVRLGVGCWVFANAFIAPGVTIGRGAIVGAAAVVTKNVESYHIVAGNPARFIKKRKRIDEVSA